MEEMDRLLHIMERLRGPDGCPWDRRQTHESLQPFLIEEACELLQAIEAKDDENMAEELGDVLFQVVFHARVAEEEERFDFKAVCQSLAEKMERRHPHVFSDTEVQNEDDVKKNWHAIKAAEKKPKEHLLDDLPKMLPSLLMAQKIQKKVARVGFDWKEVAPVIEKIQEELDEVKAEIRHDDPVALKEELGDLLFAVVNLCRFYDIDAEGALRQSNAKFKKRFDYVEDAVKKSGKTWESFELEELDVFWEEAKKK